MLPSSILSVRGIGNWELQKCLWGLGSGISCPETEAVKSLGLFQAVHAGCCLFTLLCFVFVYWSPVRSGNAWLQFSLLGGSSSLQPVHSPSAPAPNITWVCPRLLGLGAACRSLWSLWVVLPGCLGRERLSLNVGFRRAFLSLIDLVDF